MTSSRIELPGPHERACPQRLRRQITYFAEGSLSRSLLDAIPAHLAVLNRQRQIVYANKVLRDLLQEHRRDLGRGMRPGEALDCVYAREGAGGCGTGEACRSCGANLSIFASLQGREHTSECSLCRQIEGRTEFLELRVRSVPWEHAGERFTLFYITDISHERRRRALERIFFHDVLNAAASVKGYAELLRDDDLPDRREIAGYLHDAMQQVVEEISAQRLLSAAESRDLQLELEPLNSLMVLEQVLKNCRGHALNEQCGLAVCIDAEAVNFVSDSRLIKRVLGNMVKNALEASRPGEGVSVGCNSKEGEIVFHVHNCGFIPAEEQIKIFRRSFSTKGRDRGLGTYSIRLLSEYLGGSVSFTSSGELGTTFFASYPISSARTW